LELRRLRRERWSKKLVNQAVSASRRCWH